MRYNSKHGERLRGRGGRGPVGPFIAQAQSHGEDHQQPLPQPQHLLHVPPKSTPPPTQRYQECLQLIAQGKPDEFKTYVKSLILKNTYRLDGSLELLNECHIMNKLNSSYLKCIAKN